jgi:hypothetical protein
MHRAKRVEHTGIGNHPMPNNKFQVKTNDQNLKSQMNIFESFEMGRWDLIRIWVFGFTNLDPMPFALRFAIRVKTWIH